MAFNSILVKALKSFYIGNRHLINWHDMDDGNGRD